MTQFPVRAAVLDTGAGADGEAVAEAGGEVDAWLMPLLPTDFALQPAIAQAVITTATAILSFIVIVSPTPRHMVYRQPRWRSHFARIPSGKAGRSHSRHRPA